jgi:hypothetical protein
MGMAFRQISVFGTDPFFQKLVAQGGATAPQFSFKLTANDSELFLGGVNRRLFVGDFTTLNLTHEVQPFAGYSNRLLTYSGRASGK